MKPYCTYCSELHNYPLKYLISLQELQSLQSLQSCKVCKVHKKARRTGQDENNSKN